MGPVLSSLVQLQTTEIHLRRTKVKLKKGQQAIKRQEQVIAQLNASLAATREEIKLTRLQSGRLELELRSREDEITKLRVALNTAKTNKDYSAILTRINTDKAGMSKLEDEVLALMAQIDNGLARCQEFEQQLEVSQAKLEEIRREVEQNSETIRRELLTLEQQHSQALRDVPPKEKQIFSRLADRFDGEVIAPVVEKNIRRQEYSCGGCNMSIPLERVNSLMTRDEVVTCSNCGRILILTVDADKLATT